MVNANIDGLGRGRTLCAQLGTTAYVAGCEYIITVVRGEKLGVMTLCTIVNFKIGTV